MLELIMSDLVMLPSLCAFTFEVQQLRMEYFGWFLIADAFSGNVIIPANDVVKGGD